MPTVISSGTTTSTAAETVLASDTANHTYVLAIDTAAMLNGDIIELRLKSVVLSGGSTGLAYYAAYAHVQAEPIKFSVPVPANISISATLKRVAGTDRAYPWSLLSL